MLSCVKLNSTTRVCYGLMFKHSCFCSMGPPNDSPVSTKRGFRLGIFNVKLGLVEVKTCHGWCHCFFE